MNFNKKIIGYISSAFISIVLTNLGIAIMSKERYIGLITILIDL